jgi:hypothetical protein
VKVQCPVIIGFIASTQPSELRSIGDSWTEAELTEYLRYSQPKNRNLEPIFHQQRFCITGAAVPGGAAPGGAALQRSGVWSGAACRVAPGGVVLHCCSGHGA